MDRSSSDYPQLVQDPVRHSILHTFLPWEKMHWENIHKTNAIQWVGLSVHEEDVQGEYIWSGRTLQTMLENVEPEWTKADMPLPIVIGTTRCTRVRNKMQVKRQRTANKGEDVIRNLEENDEDRLHFQSLFNAADGRMQSSILAMNQRSQCVGQTDTKETRRWNTFPPLITWTV